MRKIRTRRWGYGDVALAAIKKSMAVREALSDYIMVRTRLSQESSKATHETVPHNNIPYIHVIVQDAMTEVSRTGLPINRPLFFDFPYDSV